MEFFPAFNADPGESVCAASFSPGSTFDCWYLSPAMGKPGVSYVPKGFEAEDCVVSEKEKLIQYDLEITAK